MKNAIKIITSAVIAVIMVAMLAVSAFAYQSAFKTGGFTDGAKAKMAAMKDGDNIFALGAYDTTTYASAADYNKSGECQFCYQNNDGKWGRALKDTGWSINGMAAIGDGIIDCENKSSPGTGCNFSKKDTATKMVDANGNEVDANGYFILCGWEFAADFKVKGFKVYFNKEAYADDFDILVGKIVEDEIVWTVAYSAENIGSKLTDVTGTTNSIASFAADFEKTAEGRLIQIAVKGTDGLAAPSNKSGYLGFTMSELEVYYGEVKAATTTAAAGTTAAPATTTAAPAPATGDNSVNYVIIVAAAVAVAAAAVVATKKKEND